MPIWNDNLNHMEWQSKSSRHPNHNYTFRKQQHPQPTSTSESQKNFMERTKIAEHGLLIKNLHHDIVHDPPQISGWYLKSLKSCSGNISPQTYSKPIMEIPKFCGTSKNWQCTAMLNIDLLWQCTAMLNSDLLHVLCIIPPNFLKSLKLE